MNYKPKPTAVNIWKLTKKTRIFVSIIYLSDKGYKGTVLIGLCHLCFKGHLKIRVQFLKFFSGLSAYLVAGIPPTEKMVYSCIFELHWELKDKTKNRNGNNYNTND